MCRLSDHDGANRAGSNAGAATRAALLIEYRQGNAAGQWWKTDRPCGALIATDPAFDTLPGDAGFVDGGACRPRRLLPASCQRAWRAGGRAIAAKSAFTLGEIDRGVAGVVRDDVCRTGANTIATAYARLQEIGFDKCPWGAERPGVG
jgi:hypothetical protein